jgi:hypothetical protein
MPGSLPAVRARTPVIGRAFILENCQLPARGVWPVSQAARHA